jgi:hypothetical protein
VKRSQISKKIAAALLQLGLSCTQHRMCDLQRIKYASSCCAQADPVLLLLFRLLPHVLSSTGRLSSSICLLCSTLLTLLLLLLLLLSGCCHTARV